MRPAASSPSVAPVALALVEPVASSTPIPAPGMPSAQRPPVTRAAERQRRLWSVVGTGDGVEARPGDGGSDAGAGGDDDGGSGLRSCSEVSLGAVVLAGAAAGGAGSCSRVRDLATTGLIGTSAPSAAAAAAETVRLSS